MRDRVSQREVEVKGKMVSVGVDVHKRSSTVTVMVEGAEVVSVSCPPEYRTLKKLLDRFKEGQIQVAYEADPGGFVLYDQLVADGIDCVVTCPSPKVRNLLET